MTIWKLLRTGSEDEALKLLQRAYLTDASASNMMSLGVGYLWMRRYEDASEHFKKYRHSVQNRKPPMDDDGLYAFEGIAYWCVSDFPLAVTTWKTGLNAPYATGGVPVKLPILLHHASVLYPWVFPRANAEGLLDERIAKPWRRGWPLPLAKYIRHLITEAELEAAWTEPLSPNGLGILSQFEWQVDLHRWECAFHECFVRLDRGSYSVTNFLTKMHSLADSSLPEWADERKFTNLIWRPEYYLARCESERTDRME
jgi:hypothetical protein